MILFYDILILFLSKAGRSIPVVQVLWEHLDWVQFPAARQVGARAGMPAEALAKAGLV